MNEEAAITEDEVREATVNDKVITELRKYINLEFPQSIKGCLMSSVRGYFKT